MSGLMALSDGEAMLDRLPHRPPFRFVTTVRALTVGAKGEGTWSVRGDEDFLKGHFPGDPLVPGVLIVEALAQMAGLVVACEGDAMLHLAHANVRFHAPVRPPAVIDLRAALSRRFDRLVTCEVEAMCDNAPVTSGVVTLAQVATQECRA